MYNWVREEIRNSSNSWMSLNGKMGYDQKILTLSATISERRVYININIRVDNNIRRVNNKPC